MNHYRLLRDNKETGPYSQEEMIAKGFKPYDLIWVEGKSAGWRYPSEIPELKAFAPVIEEQPYDRFYKKPAQQKHSRFEDRPSLTPVNTSVRKKEEPRTEELKEERPIVRPSFTIQPVIAKHIHVTLPAGNSLNVNTTSFQKNPIEEKRNYQPIVATEEKKSSFTENISTPYPTIAADHTAVVKKEKTANAAAVVNVANAIHTAKAGNYYPSQPAAGFQWTTLLGLFVGIATLVGLGIMIGLSISRTKNDALINERIAKKSTPAITTPVNINAGSPIVKEENVAGDINQHSSQPETDENKALVRNAVIKSSEVSSTGELKEDKKPADDKTGVNIGSNQTVNPSVESIKKPTLAPSFDIFARQLNLTTHSYKVGAFGGISELQCTLENDSKFALDMVEVEVQYIQANNKVYKTEILFFKDIAAGTQVTLNAPKSTRGIKVTGKIIKINSKESGLLNSTAKS